MDWRNRSEPASVPERLWILVQPVVPIAAGIPSAKYSSALFGFAIQSAKTLRSSAVYQSSGDLTFTCPLYKNFFLSGRYGSVTDLACHGRIRKVAYAKRSANSR